MAYWLIKSEPFKYSWDQFTKDQSTFWDGVRNYGARNNLRSMKKGDLILLLKIQKGILSKKSAFYFFGKKSLI